MFLNCTWECDTQWWILSYPILSCKLAKEIPSRHRTVSSTFSSYVLRKFVLLKMFFMVRSYFSQELLCLSFCSAGLQWKIACVRNLCLALYGMEYSFGCTCIQRFKWFCPSYIMFDLRDLLLLSPMKNFKYQLNWLCCSCRIFCGKIIPGSCCGKYLEFRQHLCAFSAFRNMKK